MHIRGGRPLQYALNSQIVISSGDGEIMIFLKSFHLDSLGRSGAPAVAFLRTVATSL